MGYYGLLRILWVTKDTMGLGILWVTKDTMGY